MQRFYEEAYSAQDYAPFVVAEDHPFYPSLCNFIESYSLSAGHCLEIGCGRGAFQDMVDDYTGVDLSAAVGRYIHKPFYQCSATALPFADSSFDAIWSYAVLEHVPQPESALEEMQRVLRPGGHLLLAPAWQCRGWAAEGYPVRPYRDFNWLGKLVKASIPIRDSLVFRASYVMPRRFVRFLTFLIKQRPTGFSYLRLTPNYERFWMPDSDAVNSMDPFEVILWFVSRGDHCLTFATWQSGLFVRTGPLVFRKC